MNYSLDTILFITIMDKKCINNNKEIFDKQLESYN